MGVQQRPGLLIQRSYRKGKCLFVRKRVFKERLQRTLRGAWLEEEVVPARALLGQMWFPCLASPIAGVLYKRDSKIMWSLGLSCLWMAGLFLLHLSWPFCWFGHYFCCGAAELDHGSWLFSEMDLVFSTVIYCGKRVPHWLSCVMCLLRALLLRYFGAASRIREINSGQTFRRWWKLPASLCI